MLPLESTPSPATSITIYPPFIVIVPLEAENLSPPNTPADCDVSFPPAAFNPSSLATKLILPSFIVISAASNPS